MVQGSRFKVQGSSGAQGVANELGLPKELYFQWLGMAMMMHQRNEMMVERCVEVQELFRKEGMESCILKGLGVARLYNNLNDNLNHNEGRKTKDEKHETLNVKPETSLGMLRQSGDIDIWVKGSREAVIDSVMKHCLTREFDQKHIHLHVFDDVDVEAHWYPAWPSNHKRRRALKAYYEQEIARQCAHGVTIGDSAISVPTNDFQLFHQMLHLQGHYLYEGVGMRQLMDCYFTLQACTPEEREAATAVLVRLGMKRFIGAAMWVMGYVFCNENDNQNEKRRTKDDDSDLKHETLKPETCHHVARAEWMIAEPDEKEGRKLLDSIMEGGNFGHYDQRNNAAGETAAHRLWRRIERKMRLFRYDPMGTLQFPIERVKLELWMRKVRREYGV